jgi:hypothetical protein
LGGEHQGKIRRLLMSNHGFPCGRITAICQAPAPKPYICSEKVFLFEVNVAFRLSLFPSCRNAR